MPPHSNHLVTFPRCWRHGGGRKACKRLAGRRCTAPLTRTASWQRRRRHPGKRRGDISTRKACGYFASSSDPWHPSPTPLALRNTVLSLARRLELGVGATEICGNAVIKTFRFLPHLFLLPLRMSTPPAPAESPCDTKAPSPRDSAANSASTALGVVDQQPSAQPKMSTSPEKEAGSSKGFSTGLFEGRKKALCVSCFWCVLELSVSDAVAG